MQGRERRGSQGLNAMSESRYVECAARGRMNSGPCSPQKNTELGRAEWETRQQLFGGVVVLIPTVVAAFVFHSQTLPVRPGWDSC